MGTKFNRRDLVRAGAVAGLVAATPKKLFGKAPAVRASSEATPVVISSANGHRYKNGGEHTGVEIAFEKMMAGEDVLDAVLAAVNLNELDPTDSSVGYGGLPNADGVVQLDSCCMHGPRRQAGGVACLEGVRTPSLVARAVMAETDHHLLVGDDARTFARNLGFEIEDDLNTEHSRERWLEWKRRSDPRHYPDPKERAAAGREVARQMVAEGKIDPEHYWGTINCDAINATGEICGVTTTSGLAWKIPGRVGDSPILGAGLYVDGEVGAVGSTGRGEANLYNLTCFLICENLRRGMAPKDAGMEGLRRIQANTVEKRLLNSRGLPNFGISFYVLDRSGRHAGVSMYASLRSRYAVCTDKGASLMPLEPLLEGSANDE
jgi:N4-(beta-N-acetylglucosaminyl)-L-asparaginase